MKNIAYSILLIASFAVGIFGAFMAYHGLELPRGVGQTMSDCTFIGIGGLMAGAFGVVMTCMHAIQNSR